MPQFSRGLYLRPDVHINIEDGRSFARRSTEKYQVIQATLVDTWASTAAGAFALSENNLYTTDAFRDYLSHLTDDGLLTFTRWGFDPPRESLRLVSLAIAGARINSANTMRRATFWQAASARRRSSTDSARRTRCSSRARRSPMRTWRAPARRSKPRAWKSCTSLAMARRLRSASCCWRRIRWHSSAAYQFDITPVTDNRPFFFYTVQPRDIAAFLLQSGQAADAKINVAVPKLFQALAVSLIAVVIIMVLPPIVLGTRLPQERSVRSFLLYFLAIGMGYILIEVALIQKFVLFLGHPTYALTVVIFSMLVSSGIGSFVSRKMVGDNNNRLVAALAIGAGLVGVLAAIRAACPDGRRRNAVGGKGDR